MMGLWLIACHLVGDFILQTDRMASNKLDSNLIRLEHVLVYLIPFCSLSVFYEKKSVILFLALAGVSHYITDTRRWAKPKENFESYPIVVDQTLHIVQLAIIGLLFELV